MPDGQPPPCPGKCRRLGLCPGIGHLNPIQGAREAGINISPDEPTDDNDVFEKGGGSAQAVELPRGVPQYQVGPYQPGENMKLEPGFHAAPAGFPAVFSEGIQGFGQ